MAAWKWLTTILHGTANDNRITPLASSSTTCETSLELGSKKVRRDIDCPSAYEFYTMFRPGNAIHLYEWHVNIPENNNALKAAEKFHQDIEKLTLSSSIIDKIDIIKETLLKSMPVGSACNTIEEDFRDARSNDSPLPILKAYTVTQTFTNRINTVLAENTHHALKLYCTQLNCPILVQTQEYIEAITSIFFHPKLDDLLVRKKTVYRGAVLEDEKLVANWKDGAEIITTTFLSTSTILVLPTYGVTLQMKDQDFVNIIFVIPPVVQRSI